MSLITAEFLKSLGVTEAAAAQITAKQAEKEAPAGTAPAQSPVPPPPVIPSNVIPSNVVPAVSVAPYVPPAQTPPAAPAVKDAAPKSPEKPAEAPPAAREKTPDPMAELQAKVEELQNQYKEAQAQLAARAYEDAVKAAVEGAKLTFSSKAAERDFYHTAREKAFKVKPDGTLDGLAEHIKAMQKAEPDMFAASDKPAPRFATAAAPSGGQEKPQSSPAKKIVDRYLSEQYGVKPENAAPAPAEGSKKEG